jgi:hypothetical protein
MQEKERVLFVVRARAIAARAAKQVVEEGGEAIVVASTTEARFLEGTFDRGVFSFDLPDGSGIVFAAELMLESRIGYVEFFHPRDELVAREHPSEVRWTSGSIEPEERARDVA